MTGREKLEQEEKILLENTDEKYRKQVKSQYDLVFDEMKKKADADPEFNDQVLQDHKSWERCYKYCAQKARNMCAKGSSSCAVISTTLFEWIYEYYALDDKAEVEKEIHDKKEREERLKAQKEKVSQHTKSAGPEPLNSTKPKSSSKKKKNEDPNQISLFELFN